MNVTTYNCSIGYDNEMGVSLNEILYTIKRCKENPELRAGIFINHPEPRRQCADLVTELIKEDMSYRCSAHRHTGEVSFIFMDNGSMIRFLYPSDTSRACRLHIALIGDDVDDLVVQHVIKPLIRPYNPPNTTRAWAGINKRAADVGDALRVLSERIRTGLSS